MAKFCIFCGLKPTDKNKEHVIPRWLIRLTGDEKRLATFGTGPKAVERNFAFDQFTFPACEVCNSKYSALEGDASKAMASLLDYKTITALQLSRLLDWFDKVRIGLWLGFQQLDKNFFEVKPNFHIDQRIGQHDRCIFITRSSFKNERLNFLGVNTPSFTFTPSVFQLIVNNLYITNISSGFLLARRLGFPFPDALKVTEGHSQLQFNLYSGTGRKMHPVVRRTMPAKTVRIYQPMFAQGLVSEKSDLYNSDYVESHCLDHDAGVGGILVETDAQPAAWLQRDQPVKIDIPVTELDEDQRLHSIIDTFDWQNWVTQQNVSFELLSAEKRRAFQRFIGSLRKSNVEVIEQQRDKLRKNRLRIT